MSVCAALLPNVWNEKGDRTKTHLQRTYVVLLGRERLCINLMSRLQIFFFRLFRSITLLFYNAKEKERLRSKNPFTAHQCVSHGLRGIVYKSSFFNSFSSTTHSTLFLPKTKTGIGDGYGSLYAAQLFEYTK
jgi:hypothetical protein